MRTLPLAGAIPGNFLAEEDCLDGGGVEILARDVGVADESRGGEGGRAAAGEDEREECDKAA
jgi:hypothetical protein